MSTGTSAEDIVEEILSKQPRNYEITREECIEISTQSYNKAIADILSIIQKYNTGKELSPLFNQLVPKIEALVKHS